MEKALIVASVASMIDQFNMPNISLLKDMGYEVSVATNFNNGSTCSNEKIEDLKKRLTELNVSYYQIDFSRNVFNIRGHFKAIRQLKQIAKNGSYKLVHCHSPIGGLITRIVFNKYRKHGTKVIYTAHGFHFFHGAPLKNWIIFYPIEKICSKLTDILITINTEDFVFSKQKMKAKKIRYIHGVGVDTSRFSSLPDEDKNKKRNELGLDKNDIMLLSVGELNRNKNHEIVIRALSQISNKNIHYFIAGKGELDDYLVNLSKRLNILNNIHLLGFRSDVSALYNIADIFIHPSFREGLSVAVMEAMSNGLPMICSKIRGNTDLLKDSEGGYLVLPSSVEQMRTSIMKITDMDILQRQKMGKVNIDTMQNFSVDKVMLETKAIYQEEAI